MPTKKPRRKCKLCKKKKVSDLMYIFKGMFMCKSCVQGIVKIFSAVSLDPGTPDRVSLFDEKIPDTPIVQ